MYTEDDLRATFTDLEREAPDLNRVVNGLERRRHKHTTRRRTFGIAAVGLVTAAVAASALVVPNLWNSPAPVAPAAENMDQYKQHLRFPFAIDPPEGFQVAYRIRSADKQNAWVYPAHNYEQALDVIVFAPGTYDPTHIRSGEPVDVRGKKGFFRRDAQCHCSTDDPVSGLAWEYAPNAWALVQNGSPKPQQWLQDKAVLLRIANGVAFDRTTPLQLPFRVGYLPGGLRPVPDTGSVNVVTPGGIGGQVSLRGTGPRAAGLGLLSTPLIQHGLPVGEPDIRVLFGEVIVTINIGHSVVRVSSSDSPDGLPQEELMKIARSITPAADLNNPSTWFNAEDALPLN